MATVGPMRLSFSWVRARASKVSLSSGETLGRWDGSSFLAGTRHFPRVRPDDLAGKEIGVASQLFERDFCFDFSGTRRLIPESEMMFLESAPPDLGARPPLHLERR